MKKKWILPWVVAWLAVAAVAQDKVEETMARQSVEQGVRPMVQGSLSGREKYGIQEGNGIFSWHIGAGSPISQIDSISGVNLDEDWGRSGLAYGIQALYAVSDYFLLGAEVSGVNFKESRFERGYNEFKVKVRQTSYMAASRIYFNPQERVRMYIPLGIGKSKIKGKLSVSGLGTDSTTDSAVNLYAGIGMEVSATENMLLGAEIRFSHANFNKKGIRADVDHMDFLARLGFKF